MWEFPTSVKPWGPRIDGPRSVDVPSWSARADEGARGTHHIHPASFTAGAMRPPDPLADRGTARVALRIASALSDEPAVLAVFLNGSTVAGTDQHDSDRDFTVIVRRRGDRAAALRLLRRRFRYLGLGARSTTVAR